MSEKLERSDHTFLKRAGYILAGVALGTGGIKYGPEILDRFDGEDSLIVAGVPGQIESYNHRNRVVNIKPYMTRDAYWLGIEQCPNDIASASNGEITATYNPEVGVTDPACHFDWVRVSGDTYSGVRVGDQITFDGSVGQPLKK